MCVRFSDDDVGKRVVDANGETVGMVTVVEGDVAHVEPDPGIVASIKATIGWDEPGANALALDEASVAEITGDGIHLRGDLRTGAGASRTSESAGEERTRRPGGTKGTSTGEAPTGEDESATSLGTYRGTDAEVKSGTEPTGERTGEREVDGRAGESDVDDLATDETESVEDRERDRDEDDDLAL